MRFTDLIKEGQRCWKGYEKKGTKMMFGKRVNNCVKREHVDFCVHCGDILLHESLDEHLIKWFKDKWVNIGKKDKSGKHPPCGSSGKKRGYAKCVPASKAAGMTKKQKASATRRKRAAQNKAGRGGTSSLKGGGKKPIRVSTKPKK